LFNSKILHRLGSMGVWLSLLFVELATYMVFLVVPTEKVMGAIQRIFYFHVGSALACYLSFGVAFVASLAVLATRKKEWDSLNVAASEVGFMFCSVTLGSGMIWAKTAWNTWFRWEPRLVTFLLLWMIFAGFIILRRFGDENKLEVHSAVVGIMGSLMVPIVWLSVYFLPQVAQLHPKVVEEGGLRDSSYVWCFVISSVALLVFALTLIWIRTRLERVRLLKIVQSPKPLEV
jgi:heme exporter protein C